MRMHGGLRLLRAGPLSEEGLPPAVPNSGRVTYSACSLPMQFNSSRAHTSRRRGLTRIIHRARALS